MLKVQFRDINLIQKVFGLSEFAFTGTPAKFHGIDYLAYISMKSNDCSGIWFTKCISISVFIIGNHFVTPFDQTNAQNRIRIISVFLKIGFYVGPIKNLLTFKEKF